MTVRYKDVIEAVTLGFVTIETGYDSLRECPFLAVKVKEGYCVTDEFMQVVKDNDIDLFMRIRQKEVDLAV